MAENTEISWCDATYNPWWGCTRVSDACDHCYAETLAHRYGMDIWGVENRRRFFGDKHWNEPLMWNRKARNEGKRRRVFCASMADVFERLPEGHPDEDSMAVSRQRLWSLIEKTSWLDWLLLTKRPQSISHLVPSFWMVYDQWPKNAWVGTTVESQKYTDRLQYLCSVPAPVRFVSYEPAVGPLDLAWVRINDHTSINYLEGCGVDRLNPCQTVPNLRIRYPVNWVIAGGESGSHARPSHPDWFRSIRDDCKQAGVVFHFKQWGEYGPEQIGRVLYTPVHSGIPMDEPASMFRVGKKAAGRLLDGVEHNEFPSLD